MCKRCNEKRISGCYNQVVFQSYKLPHKPVSHGVLEAFNVFCKVQNRLVNQRNTHRVFLSHDSHERLDFLLHRYLARQRFLMYSLEILRGKLVRVRSELIPLHMPHVWPLCDFYVIKCTSHVVGDICSYRKRVPWLSNKMLFTEQRCNLSLIFFSPLSASWAALFPHVFGTVPAQPKPILDSQVPQSPSLLAIKPILAFELFEFGCTLNPSALQLFCKEASAPISDFHALRPSEVLRYCPSAIKEYRDSAGLSIKMKLVSLPFFMPRHIELKLVFQ